MFTIPQCLAGIVVIFLIGAGMALLENHDVSIMGFYTMGFALIIGVAFDFLWFVYEVFGL